MTMHSHGSRRQLFHQNDDKVFSRQLTKDSSSANSSSRVFYYAGSAGSVPFRWESCPGTPKHPSSSSSSRSSASIIPPLTPPPSYQVNVSRSSTPDHTGQRSKPKVVTAILSKLSLSPSPRRMLLYVSPASSVSSPSSSSSSSSSSSTWSSSVYLSPLRLSRDGRRKNLSCTRFPLAFRLGDDEADVNRHHKEADDGEDYLGTPSPTSTLRFGPRRSNSNRGSRLRGCYPVKSVRNTLYSIIGHQGSV